MTNQIERIIPIWKKLNLSFEEAAEYTGIGVNKLRQLARDPRCLFALRMEAKTLLKEMNLKNLMKDQVFYRLL